MLRSRDAVSTCYTTLAVCAPPLQYPPPLAATCYAALRPPVWTGCSIMLRRGKQRMNLPLLLCEHTAAYKPAATALLRPPDTAAAPRCGRAMQSTPTAPPNVPPLAAAEYSYRCCTATMLAAHKLLLRHCCSSLSPLRHHTALAGCSLHLPHLLVACSPHLRYVPLLTFMMCYTAAP